MRENEKDELFFSDGRVNEMGNKFYGKWIEKCAWPNVISMCTQNVLFIQFKAFFSGKGTRRAEKEQGDTMYLHTVWNIVYKNI